MKTLKLIGQSIVVGICLIIIFFTGKSIITEMIEHPIEGSTQTTPAPVVEEKFNEVEVYIDAREGVLRQLKAPSTAKFPSSSHASIIEYETNKFYVRGYVDAENSFGAKIRSNWFVDMEYIGDLVKFNEIIIN